MDRRDTPGESLNAFLADKCEATKAKYVAEFAHSDKWTEPLDHWYAESLVFFGLLELRVEVLYDDSGKHIRGSRTKYRRMPVAPGEMSLGSAQSESGPLSRVHAGSVEGSFRPSGTNQGELFA